MKPLWGPVPAGPGTMRFRLWAPGREALSLEIEGRGPAAMERGAEGWFAVHAPAGPGTRYRFVLDDGMTAPDPASRAQANGVHGWSVVVDPMHEWREEHWRGRPWEEAVIQEVHAGLHGGFRGLAGDLERIAAIGVTAIELMPVGAFGGDRGWGYDGVLPFAPHAAYGTPEDLRALVDRAHGLGLMVLLDVVYNHFGPDGNYLGAYAPRFFHADADTPWGGAVAVDEPPVAAFFLENALMWLRDYRFDGLRLDAVHAICNPAFLDRLARDIRAELPGRHVHLILENEDNDAARLGGGRYDAQWNDDFHNVMHVLLTGETAAYYADFADRPAERLARCLAEGFVYQGESFGSRDGEPRGSASAHLPPSAFVAFLQNHDQIGNRALGERLTVLAEGERLRAATALLLLSPQIPLLFMGDECGSRSPFLFFTDFHNELADAVREGRRREFAKFEAFRDESMRARIPDPNALATFEASRAQPGPDAAEWQALYRRLLAIRTERIVPRLKGTRSHGAQAIGAGAVLARWRMGDGALLGMAINLGESPVDFPRFDGEPLFAQGEPGAPGSFACWLAA